jgi:hypothetical protein
MRRLIGGPTQEPLHYGYHERGVETSGIPNLDASDVCGVATPRIDLGTQLKANGH